MRQVGNIAYTGQKMYTKVLVVKREETGPLKDLDMKMGYKDIR
jgi:hypothetical protein